MLKEQKFGVELEMTGISRERAAQVLAEYFGTNNYRYVGGVYKAYEAIDAKGRVWKVMFDSSIRSERGEDNKTEVVSPVLEYEDIEFYQEAIRRLRRAGARVNESCGLHIHVDASNHDARSLRNLINIMRSKEDLLYKALGVTDERADRWCRKVDQEVLDAVNKKRPRDLKELGDLWYKGDSESRRMSHYHYSRYHGLNLHNVWYRGTVEFRMFNATLHAGKIKAYIQLCLAISAQAIQQRSASPKKTETTNEKFTFRTWLLRLGLIGDEFATARKHLLANLEGNSAWRYRVGA